MTRPQIPAYAQAPELFADPQTAYDELIRLASLARAVDPSLPPHVRFFQRGQEADIERQQVPGRVVFTSDTRPHLDGGLQDPNAVDLFEALEKTLPSHTVSALKQRLDGATSSPSRAGIVAQAFTAAASAGRVSLSSTPTHDPDVAIVSSPAMAPPALAFSADPFLGEIALANVNRLRQPGEDPAFDHVSAIGSVRQALSKDASKMSAPQVQAVVESIRSLDGAPGEGSYESRTQQGWLAYSVMAGGQGWARPLLTAAPDVVSPHTSFRGVSPIAAAVLANDAQTVGVLLEQGVSANVYLPGLPPAVHPSDRARLEDRLGDRFPLSSLAAASGSSAALGKLIQNGAMMDVPGSEGRTPLHQAVLSGDEPTVRVLVAHGADPTLRDANGQSAQDMATGPLKDVLKASGMNAEAPATPGPSMANRRPLVAGGWPTLDADSASPAVTHDANMEEPTLAQALAIHRQNLVEKSPNAEAPRFGEAQASLALARAARNDRLGLTGSDPEAPKGPSRGMSNR